MLNPQSRSVILLLGSNLGDRLSMLLLAEERIGQNIGEVSARSSVYESPAWGFATDSCFLNRALRVSTMADPHDILRICKRIEKELGRVDAGKWTSRVIDIDVLCVGQETLMSDRLTIPHVLLHERRFALVPLVELAGSELHPVFGVKYAELLAVCSDRAEVNRYDVCYESV